MLSAGDIVAATAGRDSGKVFIVVGIFDENHVLIADGKSRKADFPKKKKIKHTELLKAAGEDFAGSLNLKNLKNGKFTNSVIRKILSEEQKNNY
ncbi:MAG: KOW domain-containing RNA-binding protein [Oscillospiraceae bacterium]|nr:KOW domain-containing RNA-binding protein [Oscillospiraceae bacterium]